MKRKPKYLSKKRTSIDKTLSLAARRLLDNDERAGYKVLYTIQDIESAARRNRIPVDKVMALCSDRIKPADAPADPADTPQADFSATPATLQTITLGKWLRERFWGGV